MENVSKQECQTENIVKCIESFKLVRSRKPFNAKPIDITTYLYFDP